MSSFARYVIPANIIIPGINPYRISFLMFLWWRTSSRIAVWMIHAIHAALDSVDMILSPYTDARSICDDLLLFFIAMIKNNGRNAIKNIARCMGLSNRN
jgi:hypothetical protein